MLFQRYLAQWYTCGRCAWQQLTTLTTWWLKTDPRQRRWLDDATRRGCRKPVDDSTATGQWQGTPTKVGHNRRTDGRTARLRADARRSGHVEDGHEGRASSYVCNSPLPNLQAIVSRRALKRLQRASALAPEIHSRVQWTPAKIHHRTSKTDWLNIDGVSESESNKLPERCRPANGRRSSLHNMRRMITRPPSERRSQSYCTTELTVAQEQLSCRLLPFCTDNTRLNEPHSCCLTLLSVRNCRVSAYILNECTAID